MPPIRYFRGMTPSSFPVLRLRKGRERSLLNRHPYVFSGGIAAEPKAKDGEIVEVRGHGGEFLGYGHYAPGRNIRCRMFHFGEPCAIDAAFWQERFERALRWRRSFIDPEQTTGYRLIHGEGDGLPGMVLDVYGEAASLQVRSAGLMPLLPQLQDWLKDRLNIRGLYLQTRKVTQEKGEGGEWIFGEEMAAAEFLENGYTFTADIGRGQKTGFFLDQRDNREIVGKWSRGRKVLNAFSYSGAFSVYALGGGAEKVVSVDLSEEAIRQSEAHVEQNFGADAPHEALRADVFDYLREMPESAFDMIILDPPAFTKHRSTVDRAARGYKDINLRALRALPPGGLLFTFSCSQHVDTALFRKIVFGAAADAGRPVRVAAQLSQGPDHAFSIYHPEGEYLKGLMLQVD